MLNEWQRRRSEFNHDWLKNQFLNRLNAFLERLRGGNPDVEKLLRFVREDLPELESHEIEARWLIESVEEEMTPRRFFEYPPLNRCSEETKRWLPDVVHEVWLNRYPVRSLRNRATDLLLRVNHCNEKLKKHLENTASGNAMQLVSLGHEFAELSRLCAELHDTLSAFDVKVKRI